MTACVAAAPRAVAIPRVAATHRAATIDGLRRPRGPQRLLHRVPAQARGGHIKMWTRWVHAAPHTHTGRLGARPPPPALQSPCVIRLHSDVVGYGRNRPRLRNCTPPIGARISLKGSTCGPHSVFRVRVVGRRSGLAVGQIWTEIGRCLPVLGEVDRTLDDFDRIGAEFAKIEVDCGETQAESRRNWQMPSKLGCRS